MALRVPDPVRFDAYCMLKGLADIEPTTLNSSGLSPWTACQAVDDASVVGLSAVSSSIVVPITNYLHVESLMHGIVLPKVVAPVITYLESVYSAQSMVYSGNQNLSDNTKALEAVHAILNVS